MAKCFLVASEIGSLEIKHKLKCQIRKTGRNMCARGLVVACEGNLSVRLDGGRILVTPAGTCKGYLAPEDLLVMPASLNSVQQRHSNSNHNHFGLEACSGI